MARIEWVESRLQVWAQWIKVGDGSGYPTKGTLHPEWSPPTGGVTPTLKVSAPSSARRTHRHIGFLSVRMANTLVMHYVLNLSAAEHAERAQCGPRAVQLRIEVAHRLLAAAFAADG